MKVRKKIYGENSTQDNIININSQQIINICQNKEEILFSQKSFLEILLGLIKNSQIEYLTNKKKNTAEKKRILLELKNNLQEIKKEKEKNENLFLRQKEQKEKNLRNILFNPVYTKRSISNSNYININYETLITENNENFDDKETPQLKLLNFKVENEIKKVENKLKRNQFLIQYYKNQTNDKSSLREKECDLKKDDEIIEQLLHDKLLFQREKFIETVNLKSQQDMKISTFQTQSLAYKLCLQEIQSPYKYVKPQEIIEEEENNKSCMDTINEEDKEKSLNKNLKLINMNDVEKLLNLNMNINVNINLNKQYINNHFDSNENIKDNIEKI